MTTVEQPRDNGFMNKLMFIKAVAFIDCTTLTAAKLLSPVQPPAQRDIYNSTKAPQYSIAWQSFSFFQETVVIAGVAVEWTRNALYPVTSCGV